MVVVGWGLEHSVLGVGDMEMGRGLDGMLMGWDKIWWEEGRKIRGRWRVLVRGG